MKKSGKGQSAHDKKVQQIARKLTNQNWRVKADISGYDKPNPIGKDKQVPDVEATKHGHRRIVEVETPDTVNKDRKQQQSFRRHAGQKSNTTFDVEVTN